MKVRKNSKTVVNIALEEYLNSNSVESEYPMSSKHLE